MPATTIPLTAPQEGAEFYNWSFPGAPVQVHLYLKVVQGIRQCLAQASGAAVSTKGVLLGNIVTPGVPEITGFRPLHTENPEELEETIAFFRSSEDNLLPIGYFRTNDGDRLALSPEDLSLAQAYFPDSNCVFLLIEATAAEAPNAGFFFWDRGKMNGGFYDFCFLEFPFDLPSLTTNGQSNAKTDPQPARDLAPVEPLSPATDPSLVSVTPPSEAEFEPVESHPLAAPPKPLSPAAPPPEVDSTPAQPKSIPETRRNPDTAPKPRHSWRTLRPALAAVLLAVSGIAAGIFLPQRLAWVTGMDGNPEPKPIALKVERQGTDLSVSWNHNSTWATRAETGRLKISDGETREFPLDKNQIRSGSVVYSPVTSQVRIQLDLQGPDQSITSESVMVVLNRPGAAESVAQPADAQPRQAFRRAPASAGAPSPGSPAAGRIRAAREFLPPQQPAAAQPPIPELSPPPRVTATNSAPLALLTPVPVLPHSQPPSAPKASSAVNPRAPSQAPAQPSEQLSSSDFVAAIPIRQALPPPLTPAQRSFLSRTVEVKIKISIDASGNVRKTEPLTQANPVLVTAAQAAARLWTFHPARQAGKNVASEMILRFKFNPPN